ncbi:sensor histidine kinase [Paenibacillus sp. UMB4589-SE434]|uniref:sensor histidine kinase n=1 Tax=Paenibacillus sp. UMB4589-SE434 TaxID=3046314 RepID=UPI0025501809|nr:sensor histidine kinase [Paenibacillus sp. UMB4589-SE434]MDK8180169.1 sensor histidine kinase [Paenibacillus sp. UMB4589-SE434]
MKLFIKDNTSYIILHIIQFIFLYSTFRWLDVNMVASNIVYLFLVSIFMLLIYLIFRYVAGRGGYKWLSNIPDLKDAKVFLQMDVTAPLLHTFKRGLARQYQLLQSEKERSIQEKQEQIDFMNRFVHLLKTPLSALHLIVQDREDSEGAEEMQMEIARMEYQLNMILTLSRMSSFRQDFYIQTVPIGPLVFEVINDLKSHFIHQHIFPSADVQGDATVLSDRKWLKFVLTQLVTNSIRYSDGGNRQIRIWVRRQGAFITLTVNDEGVGISPQDLPRVFDLYFTGANGRKYGESTGIGLYLVRKICDELGHKVSIQSSLGVGTEVKIDFPLPYHPDSTR